MADGSFATRYVVDASLFEPRGDALRAERAANGLADRQPQFSARRMKVRRPVFALGAPFLAAALIDPAALVSAVLLIGIVFFAVMLMLRFGLTLASVQRRRDLADACAAPLPVYTVLIALKDEAAMAPQISRAMAAFDYPADRLDIKLLIEDGDRATAEALRAEAWPEGTELHVLPKGRPQTKPRALNYGLCFARGQFVTVYDAEDRPRKDQLRAAVAAFAAGGAQLACVQAPLVGQAAGGRWISAQWALEYAGQFGQVLPGQARLGLPLMLGGTSNHFRRRALVDAGGWDAWNVTEDADLGLRLARLGYRCGVIAPPTYEAPPPDLKIWTAQRSRWLKGFLQTYGVLMRSPSRAWRELGAAGFASVQLTLGGAILSALVHGPWALWCLLCFVTPVSLGSFGSALAIVSYCTGAAVAFAAPGKKDWNRLGLVLTLPLYWPLQSLAMIRALYGLWRAPHFWAKTPHA
jgi:cellulose synthase/poly-beta-1,6-N-acetylglucosamine synthase-like glycosyltransferase